jgi:hypothetical protein
LMPPLSARAVAEKPMHTTVKSAIKNVRNPNDARMAFFPDTMCFNLTIE